MKHKYLYIVILTLILSGGWGAGGHKIMNRKAPLTFPSQMSYFLSWTDSLQRHASDADNRKSADTTESRKHFIDIDFYPEFVANGRIPQTLDSLYNAHGWSYVITHGIVPFAIPAITDSVKKCFQRGDFQKAMLFSADLGHYVADAHNPLHLTKNYDGQYTNQTGIHSRYETQMINRDSTYFTYGGDSLLYISNVQSFTFNFIYQNYQYLDSVLYADSVAFAYGGGTQYNAAYYLKLWELSGNFTQKLFKQASRYIASLIYTSWVNAGSPIPVSISSNSETVNGYKLNQNYPNPFNPTTTISYTLPKSSNVKLSVYDIKGALTGVLVNTTQSAGTYNINFNSSSLSSGIYFYVIETQDFKDTRKMTLLK